MLDGPTVTDPFGSTPPEAVSAEDDDTPRGLPFLFRLAIFIAVVALFLLARGPVWQNPWNTDALDSAIFWSYLPIPVLVAGGLLLARRFSWRFLFLESLVLTLAKYALTFSLALVFWAIKGPPPPPLKVVLPVRASATPAAVEAPPPAPTPIPIERTGTVRGSVKTAAGEPVSGAFVYVASGLEAFVFARPTEAVRVENDGASVRAIHSGEANRNWPAALVVARAGQHIEAHSLDGHLHTLVASGDTSGATFNIPMLSSGAWSTVIVREPAKVSRLRCTVHPLGESPAYLVVLDHPFFTATDGSGSFRIDGIPAAKIALATWHPTLGEGSRDLEIQAQTSLDTELRLSLSDAH